jgi:hypothetical protein
MKIGRWTAVSQSAFEWEREALDFLGDHLPDYEPWRAWSNFVLALTRTRRNHHRRDPAIS